MSEVALNNGDAQQTVSHEATLFAESLTQWGNFKITNSLVTSWLAIVIIVIACLAAVKQIKRIPGKLQGAAELVVEGGLNLADSVTGHRTKTLKIFPITLAIFLFVLVNNWLGLIPGVGSVGFIESEGSHQIFVPWLRGGTADLNTTLALALFSILGANFFGIVMLGFWRHFNKFINFKAFGAIPGHFKKDPTIIIVNPIKAFVGIIEIIGEVAKVASLSFRLFGNIFAGEVLLSSISVIFAFFLPIPFMFLEVIVGIIQALIFAMLTLVYFTIASTAEEH